MTTTYTICEKLKHQFERACDLEKIRDEKITSHYVDSVREKDIVHRVSRGH